jgi:hypothetical protein
MISTRSRDTPVGARPVPAQDAPSGAAPTRRVHHSDHRRPGRRGRRGVPDAEGTAAAIYRHAAGTSTARRDAQADPRAGEVTCPPAGRATQPKNGPCGNDQPPRSTAESSRKRQARPGGQQDCPIARSNLAPIPGTRDRAGELTRDKGDRHQQHRCPAREHVRSASATSERRTGAPRERRSRPRCRAVGAGCSSAGRGHESTTCSFTASSPRPTAAALAALRRCGRAPSRSTR